MSAREILARSKKFIERADTTRFPAQSYHIYEATAAILAALAEILEHLEREE